ncbi:MULTISPECIES: VWA domain-containing protein [Dyella]|uniref:VWA domain-containing protein n=2 Tax=Dyella TaxID=231454 RepID=A0A4R0YNW1_9GAMM|nr:MULTISPECIES: VWA domain-containing protein [Dyella]TBR36893.1 VWA domain-containing protein [Dyella terrae]TCI08016.1 VWA domain-containing protein [Dyella soli]
MIGMLQDFHFLRPLWLLGLLAVPVLWWMGSRRSAAQRELARLVDPELLPHVLYGKASTQRSPAMLMASAAALCALALAGPTWSRVDSPLYANQSAQVVAISLSQRMLARDVAPTRLDRAKLKARDLLDVNRDGLNGLIAYAGEAFAVAPLTNDAASLHDLLDALSPDTMPIEGDDAAQAIERGAQMIHDAKAGHGDVVLITDAVDKAAIDAAARVAQAGVTVSVLGIGTPQGAPIPLSDGSLVRGEHGDVRMARRDDASLEALADAGDGRFVLLSDDATDVKAIHDAMRSSGMGATVTDARGDEWQDRGAWFLLPLLPIAALAFRRGWVLVAALMFLPLASSPAQASGWTDLWKRPDQQAAQALKDGHAEQAQQLARDPAWRGVAAYRAAKYDEAAEALQQAKGADAAYNLGNTLAQQQKYKEAIVAYDRALKLDPRHQDALANRKAVEDWMREHPDQPQDKQKDDNDKKGQGKDGQSAGTPKDDKDQKSGKSDDKDDTKDQQNSASNQSQDPNGKGKDQPQQQGSSDSSPAKPQSAKEQAEQKAQAEKARQALQKQMDAAMQQKDAPAKQGKDDAHELGQLSADDPQSKLPDDVRRALQRVPDDPGALLRRKFELEYRQRHGASGEEGE